MWTIQTMNACIGHRVAAARMQGFLSDVWDTVTSPFVDAATWVRHLPGFEQAGDALGDFAKTAVGKIVLRAISDTFFGPLASVVGPQLASIVWAIPGLTAGDDFFHAWLLEFKTRCDELVQYASGDPALAALVTKQVGDATEEIAGSFDVSEQCTWAFGELARRIGIREDAAAYARSLWNKIDLPNAGSFDPATGRYLAFAGGAAHKVLELTNADMRVDTTAIFRPRLAASNANFVLPGAPAKAAAPAPRKVTVKGGAPSSHGIPPAALVAGAVGVVAIGAYVLAGKKKKGRRR